MNTINVLENTVIQLEPEAIVKQGVQFPEIILPSPSLQKVASELRMNPDLLFDFLVCQTGVDQKGQLGVIYHLRSSRYQHTCVLKVFTSDRENPSFETVSHIWPSANPFEREIYDFFGIRFNGHPELKRIFLDEDFNGFPLRKDFVDELNIIQK